MPAPTNRQPHIQGLRALAVLAVVAFHAGLPVPGGFVGVDVFFVISGYVITAMLQRELLAEGRIRFGRFYLRRFKRLTPALAVTVTATVVLGGFVLSPMGIQQQAAKTALGAMALVANLVIANTTGGYFDAPAGTNPLLNIWSLSVEEQFYLGFPLLMFAAWMWAQRSGRASHVRTVVAIVGIASFALAVYGSQVAAGQHIALGFYSPFTRAWEFAVGALLALSPAPRWSREGASLASLMGAGWMGMSFWEISNVTPFPGVWTLLPVLAAGLLISAAGAVDAPAQRPGGSLRVNMIGKLLASRSMVRIGDWSYSIYLWHWPMIVFATLLFPQTVFAAPIAAAVSFVPALLSYRFIEQPIRLREYSRRQLVALIAVTVLVPVTAALSVHRVADTVLKPRVEKVGHPAAAKAMHAGYALGCHYLPGQGAKDPKPCVWHAEQSGTPVYLLGDSNAAQFVEGLIDATGALHRPLTVTTSSGCPLLDIELEGPDFPGYGKDCLARNQRLLAWMKTQTPGTVVIAASDDYWFNPGWSVVTPVGRPGVLIYKMLGSLQRIVRVLQGAGHHVILIQTIPHWTGDYPWDPSKCTLAASLEGCIQRMPSSYAITRTSLVRKGILAVGAAEGSAVMDVTAQVCPRGECVTATKAMPIYRDANHITVAMSHALAPQFTTALKR